MTTKKFKKEVSYFLLKIKKELEAPHITSRKYTDEYDDGISTFFEIPMGSEYKIFFVYTMDFLNQNDFFCVDDYKVTKLPDLVGEFSFSRVLDLNEDMDDIIRFFPDVKKLHKTFVNIMDKVSIFENCIENEYDLSYFYEEFVDKFIYDYFNLLK